MFAQEEPSPGHEDVPPVRSTSRLTLVGRRLGSICEVSTDGDDVGQPSLIDWVGDGGNTGLG